VHEIVACSNTKTKQDQMYKMETEAGIKTEGVQSTSAASII